MSEADPRGFADAVDPSRLKPAGFWIRVAAQLLDGLILFPISILLVAAMFMKSLPLAVAASVPYLFYKPLMESIYGATLGKMICGLRVIDASGNKLSIGAAYVRFVFFLVSHIVSLIGTVWLYSQPAFLAEQDFQKLNNLQLSSPFYLPSMLLGVVALIDCIVVAFTDRNRAIHDMLSGSYCVWKPTARRPVDEEDERWEYREPRQ